jgi:hypothetical protein
MRNKRNKKSNPPPSIKASIELGLCREIPRHELHSGSWQQEMYDKHGRRFYESTGEEAASLDYYSPGRPIIGFVNGVLRYRYADGTFDERSIVSPEVEERAYKVGAEALDVEILPVDQESGGNAGANETITTGEAAVA